jgi:pimeloyl-ACP methyl ester carboxylesterase
MAAALRRTMDTEANRTLTLIGYSGGGVLAMLIAARVDQVRRVVTIAANLDTDAWTDHHGYSRLKGSINPAGQPPLHAGIQQIHLAGGHDDRAPAELTRKVAARQPHVRFVVVPDFDHTCCWEDAWPTFLGAVQANPPIVVSNSPPLNVAKATERR